MTGVVLFDLEYTAWEGSMAARWLRPGEFREVVQIGAVKVDPVTLDPLGEFEVLIRPRINAGLSEYLERLTGITNTALAARGIDFAQAYRSFIAFAADAVIVSFGRDDRVLLHNIDLYGLTDLPPLPRHVNIVPWLNAHGIATEGHHACDVARLCGAVFEGTEHDALDDARSLAAGARALLAKGVPNPFGEPRP
ncbi:MAG: exonuclease domain-containing protein [Rhizomicrobium sp.]